MARTVTVLDQRLLEEAFDKVSERYPDYLATLEVGCRIHGNHRAFIRHHVKVFHGLDLSKNLGEVHTFDYQWAMDFRYFNARYYDFIYGIKWFNHYKVLSDKWKEEIFSQFERAYQLALRGICFIFIMGEDEVPFSVVKQMLANFDKSMVKFYLEDSGEEIPLHRAKDVQCVCSALIIK